jgi:hypothetical protein
MPTIRTAGKDIDLNDDEVTVLAAELRSIGDGSERMADAGDIAARLEGPNHVSELDDHERFVILRATDHLRNMGATTPALIDLRDHIYGTAGITWIAYKLRHAGHPATDFTSYSGTYVAGDRLVTADEELCITDIDGETLQVVDWLTGRDIS